MSKARPLPQEAVVATSTDLPVETELAVPKAHWSTKRSYRWVILSVTVLVQISFSLSLQVIPPLAPLLQAQLDIGATQIGLLGSAMYIGTALVLVPTGWLVDLLGVRLTMLFGQIVIGACLMLAGLSQTLWQLALVLFMVGLGLSFSGPTTAKAIVTWFSSRARATAMGIKQAGVQIAGLGAALILPALGIAVGWRQSFAFVGAVIIAIGIVSFVLFRDRDGSRTQLEENDNSGVRYYGRYILLGSFSGLLDVLRNRNIVTLSVGAMFLAATQMCLTTYMVLYMVKTLGYSLVIAGVYLAVAQGGGAAGRVIWGILSDRAFGGKRRRALVIVAGLTVPLVIVMSMVSGNLGDIGLGVLAFALGFTGIGWAGLHLALVAELSGTKIAGQSTGVSLVFVYLGMMIGPPIFGAIVDRTSNYGVAWAFAAVLAFLGMVMVLFTREIKARA